MCKGEKCFLTVRVAVCEGLKSLSCSPIRPRRTIPKYVIWLFWLFRPESCKKRNSLLQRYCWSLICSCSSICMGSSDTSGCRCVANISSSYFAYSNICKRLTETYESNGGWYYVGLPFCYSRVEHQSSYQCYC